MKMRLFFSQQQLEHSVSLSKLIPLREMFARGCASRLAHRVETAIAFRLHNALGTQNERYFVAVNPTAHSLACLRIGIFVTADAARLATGVGGSPFTGRVSHPLDGKQSFMTSPHRHSPLTSLAWSHRAPTPIRVLRARHRVIHRRCPLGRSDAWIRTTSYFSPRPAPRWLISRAGGRRSGIELLNARCHLTTVFPY